VILKLDFTKAFDTVEHTTIIQMVQHLGLNGSWIRQTQQILGFATTSVLLNGVPWKKYKLSERGEARGPSVPILICPDSWSAPMYHQQSTPTRAFSTSYTFKRWGRLPQNSICRW
jgi:hypothetical protein